MTGRATGPLAGFRIVDFSQIVSGPLATMLLADQGAEVVKVEPLAGLGDLTRLLSFAKGGLSALFVNNNRGKQSIGLDLTSDAGRAVATDLCASADVVVQNFRPGAMTRLGLDYESVRAHNPDVVYCSISGFGPDGPYADRPVLDPVIQGLTGVISRQVNPEIPFPDLVRNLIADKSTAMTAAQAITAALLVRERGGGGQHIDVPMLDACLYFFWPDGMMDRTLIDDDASAGVAIADAYRLTDCADGKIVYFVASDAMRHALFDALGHPEWQDDPRFSTMAALAQPENFQMLGGLLVEAFASLTVADALDRLAAAQVPSGPILGLDEVIHDPQVVHNGAVQVWQHRHAGSVQQARPAARFSTTPAVLAEALSLRGEDTDDVLASIGRTSDEIAALRDAGVVG